MNGSYRMLNSERNVLPVDKNLPALDRYSDWARAKNFLVYPSQQDAYACTQPNEYDKALAALQQQQPLQPSPPPPQFVQQQTPAYFVPTRDSLSSPLPLWLNVCIIATPVLLAILILVLIVLRNPTTNYVRTY